jgi:hypothetical protein
MNNALIDLDHTPESNNMKTTKVSTTKMLLSDTPNPCSTPFSKFQNNYKIFYFLFFHKNIYFLLLSNLVSIHKFFLHLYIVIYKYTTIYMFALIIIVYPEGGSVHGCGVWVSVRSSLGNSTMTWPP